MPGDDRCAHLAGHFPPDERRVLALASEGCPLDAPMQVRVEDTDVCGRPDGEVARIFSKHSGGLHREARERLGQRNAVLVRPLQRERKEKLETGRAGFRLAERNLLAVVVHRGVIRANEIDRAIGKPGT